MRIESGNPRDRCYLVLYIRTAERASEGNVPLSCNKSDHTPRLKVEARLNRGKSKTPTVCSYSKQEIASSASASIYEATNALFQKVIWQFYVRPLVPITAKSIRISDRRVSIGLLTAMPVWFRRNGVGVRWRQSTSRALSEAAHFEAFHKSFLPLSDRIKSASFFGSEQNGLAGFKGRK